MIDRVNRSVEQLVDEILVMDAQDGDAKAMEKLISPLAEMSLAVRLSAHRKRRRCLGCYSGKLAGHHKRFEKIE